MGLLDFIKRLLAGQQTPGQARGSRGEPAPEVGMGLDELARRMGMPSAALEAHVPAYREFTIPKRSGGARKICAPQPATMAIQRTILRRVLGRLRAHDCATGFERGRSIATNAAAHAAKAVVLRMDLREYFDSTSADRVCQYFRAIGWNKQAGELLTKLCTLDGRLPQGAPTSPRLSNLVNYAMDARLVGMAAKVGLQIAAAQAPQKARPQNGNGVTYTRYADDIVFSLAADDHQAVSALIRTTKSIVAEYGYKLHQKRKLVIRRQHQSQRVTGLVVNDHVALPRRTRRLLRAVQHHLASDRPATMTANQLAGWQALAHMVSTQSPKAEP